VLPQQAQDASAIDDIADTFDLEVELDRSELAALLDRALALLSPATRTVLIQKYVDETPLGEIAARLGTSEGTAAVRLHRGRLALRQIFANELRDEAAIYGLTTASTDDWQTTRIWCPFCGRQKLASVIDRESGHAAFCCTQCISTGRLGIAQTGMPEIIEGVNSYKAILSRQITWLNRYYRDALSTMTTTCFRCNSPAKVHLHLGPNVPAEWKQLSGVYFKCMACDWSDTNPLRYLAFDLPETQQFWRAHPRIQVLPEREINYAGRPAVLTTFASLSDTSHLDVISAVDSFAVLDIVKTHRR
jgi:RNA polymerase sigma-70 factor (ECF subfamily)